jgi:predicted dehydrogenase
MRFPDNRIGMVHVSWLDPNKRREMTIVGSKKMAVYNDIEPLEKVRIYDNGVEAAPYSSSFGEFLYSYRYGDILSPRIKEVEPLKTEARSFLDSIASGTSPKTDGWNGLRVVEVIQAAEASLRDSGGQVPIQRTDRRSPLCEAASCAPHPIPIVAAAVSH